MKKLVAHTLLVILLVSMLAFLFSCKTSSEDNQPDGNIQNGDVNINIVVNENFGINPSDLMYALSFAGYNPKLTIDTSASTGAEIVIGNTSRDISKTAYTYLKRNNNDDSLVNNYLLYSDGYSLALVYDENDYKVMAAYDEAMNFLLEYIDSNNSLPNNKGVVASGSVNYVEYQKDADKKERDRDFEQLSITLAKRENGNEIVSALREYYTMYDEALILWFVNLYDPDTGGYYYSASARNTRGYLPDIESTQQALAFLESSGMAKDFGGTAASMIPEWMKSQIVAFIKDLQDPDGYFYHPQWSKELVRSHSNRLVRDLERGLGVLIDLGGTPTYDTIYGHKGDGLKSDGTLADAGPVSKVALPLSSNSATAVSYVISATESSLGWPDYLKDKASFETYLAGFDIKNNSYSVGSQLGTQMSQIIARDKDLKDKGADYSLCEILINYLNDNQNPQNGVWYYKYPGDVGYNPFSATDGLLKTIGCYTQLGVEFPNALLAVETAVDALSYGQTPGSIVNVYNVWYALCELFNNIVAHGGDAGKEKVEAVQARLLDMAPEAIEMTMNNVLAFRKNDGGFSYEPGWSSSTSQGMPTAVPYTAEGDVNATSIAASGTLKHMMNALGLENPDIYNKADGMLYLETLKEMGTIIKDPLKEVNEYNFDDETVGTYSVIGIENGFVSSGGIQVVEKTKTDNMLKVTSLPGGSDNLRIISNSVSHAPTCCVFEADIMVDKTLGGTFMQLFLEQNYLLCFDVINENEILLSDASSTSWQLRQSTEIGVIAKIGEWFNLRVEYFPGTHDTVRAKIYLNGKLIAVNDNYYDPKGTKITSEKGTPSSYFSQSRFVFLSDQNLTLYLDNVLCGETEKFYTVPTQNLSEIWLNIDSPDMPEKQYDFEDITLGKNYPEDFVVTENGDSVETVTGLDGKALGITSGAKDGFLISIPVNVRSADAACAIFETDILFNNCEVGAIYQLAMCDRNIAVSPLVIFNFKVVEDNGEKYVTVLEAPNGGQGGTNIENIKIKVETRTKLKIEFYTEEAASIIYVDGKLAALSFTACANAALLNAYKMELSSISEKSGTIYLDNLRAERAVKSFDNSIKPDIEEIIHGFDGTLPENSAVTGSVKVTNDGKAEIKTNSSLTLPLNKRQDVYNALHFETEIWIANYATDTSCYHINFTDSNGNIILSYRLVASDTKVKVYENTASNEYENVIAEFARGEEILLNIEYFISKGIINLYVNGQISSVSSVIYDEKAVSLECAAVSFIQTSGQSSITVDDVIIEALNLIYIEENADGDNSEDNATVITFESSTSSNLPSGITKAFRSNGAYVRVREMIKNNTASKVLSFDTAPGGVDNLYISKTEDKSNHNLTIFETDMHISYKIMDHYQFFLETKDGSALYMLHVGRNEDGYIYMQDISGTSSGAVPDRIFGPLVTTSVKENEWFNLRIEYYSGDRDTVRFKTYLNDEIIYCSYTFYGKNTTNSKLQPTSSEVDAVRIHAFNGTYATMSLDNISLKETTGVSVNDPLTYTTFVTPEMQPNDEDTAETITFEGSSYDSIPAPLKLKLTSTNAAYAIEAFIRNTQSTKALVLTTRSGGIDSVEVSITKEAQAYNVLVFSAKVMILREGDMTLAFYAIGSSGAKHKFTMLQTDAYAEFGDWANSTASIGIEGKAANSENDWFDFRVEYYINSSSCLAVRIYLNNVFVCESTNSGYAQSRLADISSLRIDTYNAADGKLILDDISLIQTTKDLSVYDSENPKPHEHQYSAEWAYDENGHWHNATCSEEASCSSARSTVLSHTFDANGTCECGYKKPAVEPEQPEPMPEPEGPVEIVPPGSVSGGGVLDDNWDTNP